MRVRVYYNLNKKCLSVQYKGKVIQHTTSIYLENVKFIVRPAGRAKVLKEKRKNVHAFVEGDVYVPSVAYYPTQVSYNPYKLGTFYEVETNHPVISAKNAAVAGKHVWVSK